MTEVLETPAPSPTPSSDPPPAPAPAPAPPPAPAPAAAFWEGFEDAALKVHPSITRYKTPEELARAYTHAEARLGVPANQLIKIPTKPDDKAGWDEVHKQLGRPDTAADYGLNAPDDAPQEVKDILTKMSETAHAAGLSKAQLEPFVQMLNAQAVKTAEAEAKAAEKAAADCTAALKTEWGGKFETYKAEIPKIVTDAVGAEGLAALEADGLGSSPTLMKVLAKVADWRAEPGKAPGAERGARTEERAMTPAAAAAARTALEADPVKGKALRDKLDPLHASVLAERSALLAAEHAKA